MTAYRLPSAPFMPRLKERQPPKKKASAADKREGMSAAHLKLIRLLPCCVCWGPGGEAHHLKISTERGMGMRATDKWALPICHDDHIDGVERVGSRNELAWFDKRGVRCLDLAAALWAAKGDLEKMRLVLASHREQQKRTAKE